MTVWCNEKTLRTIHYSNTHKRTLHNGLYSVITRDHGPKEAPTRFSRDARGYETNALCWYTGVFFVTKELETHSVSRHCVFAGTDPALSNSGGEARG